MNFRTLTNFFRWFPKFSFAFPDVPYFFTAVFRVHDFFSGVLYFPLIFSLIKDFSPFFFLHYATLIAFACQFFLSVDFFKHLKLFESNFLLWITPLLLLLPHPSHIARNGPDFDVKSPFSLIVKIAPRFDFCRKAPE